MDNRIYGYARVSSKDQNLDRQIDSLKKYVPNERDIVVDKMSGKDTNRPGLESLMYNIRRGVSILVGRNMNFPILGKKIIRYGRMENVLPRV